MGALRGHRKKEFERGGLSTRPSAKGSSRSWDWEQVWIKEKAQREGAARLHTRGAAAWALLTAQCFSAFKGSTFWRWWRRHKHWVSLSVSFYQLKETSMTERGRWELALLIWQTPWLFCSLMIFKSSLLCWGTSVTPSSEPWGNCYFSWKIGPTWALCVVYLSSTFIALLPCSHDARGLSFLQLCCENCFLKGTKWSLIIRVVLLPQQHFSADLTHFITPDISWHVSVIAGNLLRNFRQLLNLTTQVFATISSRRVCACKYPFSSFFSEMRS